MWVFLALLSPTVCKGQTFSSIGTIWSDDFAEWYLFGGENDEELGQIKLRWQLKRDWTEWDYRIGEETGTIRMVWKDKPEQWEISGYGTTINARTRWARDFGEWIISDGKKDIIIKNFYPNNANVWYVPDEKYGYLELYTVWENDPRDWYIIDELSEEVGLQMRLALIFIPVYHSFPKD